MFSSPLAAAYRRKAPAGQHHRERRTRRRLHQELIRPFQGAIRRRRRTVAPGADVAKADPEEPHAARGRSDPCQAFAGKAGLRPNPHRQRTAQARPFDLAGGVRSVWQRHDLETMKKRLKALEAKVAQEGLVLTESQLVALEKPRAKRRPTANSRANPGLLRRSGHVLRRNMKGVGRIYQQTFIDTYAKVALPSSTIARRRSPRPTSSTIGSCHSMTQGGEPARVLTDRGTEYCGNPEHHEYEPIWRSRTSTIRAPRPRAHRPLM